MLVFFLLSLVLFSCTCIFSLVRSIAAYTYFTLVYLLSRVPCVSFEYECSLSCVCVSFKYLFSVCHQHANHSSDTRFSSYAFSTYERSSVWRVENYIFQFDFLWAHIQHTTRRTMLTSLERYTTERTSLWMPKCTAQCIECSMLIPYYSRIQIVHRTYANYVYVCPFIVHCTFFCFQPPSSSAHFSFAFLYSSSS